MRGPSEAGGVVLLAAPGEPTRILYHALAAELPISRVVIEEPVSKRQLVRGRVRRLGALVVAGQLVFQGVVVPLLRRAARRRLQEIRTRYGMSAGEIDSGRVQCVRSANDDSTLELLKALRPAVVVVQGTRILSRRLLEAVGCPFINMHAGVTPLFRGVHGGYWALATGRPDLCGVTVHLVDPGVDTGGILAQARVACEPGDSFVTYPYLQLGVGLPLLRQAVRDALEGRVEVHAPPSGESRVWSHPTVLGYAWRRLWRGIR